MIKYSLRCDNAHAFESWFSDSTSFDMQAKRGFVACPLCNSTRISKEIMAPRVVTSERKASANPPAVAEKPVEAVFDADSVAMREMVRSFRAMVTANTEDVGKSFAEESRKMHYGEAESRAIRGEATGEDVRDLLEEGIRVLPIPILPDERN